MKRSKQLTKVIDKANVFLRVNNIMDEYHVVMLVTTSALIDLELYKGFAYFVEEQGFVKMVTKDYAEMYRGFIQIL